MTPIYFRVNNKIIFNQLLARYESFVSRQPVELVCHDEQYNRLNWLEEPQQTIDQLMDSHAINLRNKNQKIILLWSGGTDSHTIYNVFKRNNLHIDEIVIFVGDQYEPWYSDQYVEWLAHNHHDPLTKITIKSRFDPVAKQQIVRNEDWLFQNTTLIPKMVMGTADSVMWDYCAQQYGGSTWCLIIGLEQPRVFFKDRKYYSCQDSKYLLSAIGFENIECFFTEPLIALKQSHMIKRMLKTRIKIDSQDIDGFQFRSSSNAAYYAWQRGIGRHDEAIAGMSHYQKKIETDFEHEPVNLSNIDGNLSRGFDRALDALLQKNDDMAVVFMRGIKNLLLEKDFCNHLVETSTGPNKSLIGKSVGQPIYSKFFCIGE